VYPILITDYPKFDWALRDMLRFHHFAEPLTTKLIMAVVKEHFDFEVLAKTGDPQNQLYILTAEDYMWFILKWK
jgi:hypothetical protein